MDKAAYTSLELDAIKRLDSASEWLVRYGVFVLSKRGESFLKEKLHHDGPVILWVRPQIETKHTLIQFRIKTGDFNYDIEALHREEIHGQTYEYWMTQTSAQAWATPLEKCIFHIVVVEADGKRSILIKSEIYIESYRTLGGALFKLPEKDLGIQYRLKAWKFSESFPNSPLPQTVIDVIGDGEYKARPAE